jgi:hypothetical protein
MKGYYRGGGRYVFVDNKSSTTNIIFTGCGQNYYMMISWFDNETDYNYLYLNPKHIDFKNTSMCTELISSCCNSICYNMIGISYGGYAAIIYSSLLPTSSVIITDPMSMRWEVQIEEIIKNSRSVWFIHRSLNPHDVAEYTQLRNILEQSSVLYFSRCSLSNVHSSNIPNEETIMQYLNFSRNILNPTCKLLMTTTKQSEISLEFLPWT